MRSFRPPLSRLPLLVAALAALALGIPSQAVAQSAYSKVLAAYEQNRTIGACEFSSSELSSALKGVDTYGAQYFADFTNAIQSALAARASGQCTTGRSSAPAAAPTHLRRPAPGSATASTDAGVPAPLVLLGLFCGLLGLLAAAVAVARHRGWDPAWAAAVRHSYDEAGYRVGGTWSEFRDWRRSASTR